MSKYHFNYIEEKWQKYWAEHQTFKAENESHKPKFYVLDMFPYPSGAGLHVGHPLGYIASDIYARYKRHQGFNVLHPQGYDSFGLPAEQFAIQTGQHPSRTTAQNIARYRKQLDRIGFSFDWSREVRTSDPDYYKWTQWIFIQLFESWYCKALEKAMPIAELIKMFSVEGNEGVNASCKIGTRVFSAKQWNLFSEKHKQKILLNYRLTYLAETEVNWCPQLGTVLANDEIVNGVSERGGYPVMRKKMKQWSMRITDYAQRLLDGLETIDWPQPLKDTQTNWIGRSKGASVTFKVKGRDEIIEVFTTRPDTIFGVSFMTLAPEHDLVDKLTTIKQRIDVGKYIEATAKRTERERLADVKRITGVFTGAYAEHPFTGEAIPIWIGDYVLAGYGTGAVMSVPCGDQRDYDFATKFDIPIPNIFEGIDISKEAYSEKENVKIVNSNFLNGLNVTEATEKAIEVLEVKNAGTGKINYKMRDAVFSRQRYWGEPFPVYYENGLPQIIDEKYLPIVLPEVEKYLPTQSGEPPLGRADIWAWDTIKNEVVSNQLIDKEAVFPLELNTMPGWAGSSCYMFRYMDPENDDALASKGSMKYWDNVDLYVGGSEHATGHLLYSRFWVKVLYDRGFLLVDEPFQKLINQGMILGESAFIFRVEGENKFVSAKCAKNYTVQPIHADVSFVNTSNEIDIEAFKNWRVEYKNAVFILENGKIYNPANPTLEGGPGNVFKVTREVEKMSKSKYNVVSPDDICSQYGADTLRMYEMFLGPLEQAKPWSTAGITGVHSFLKKLWKLYHTGPNDSFYFKNEGASKESLKTLHKTIKKVQEDIENFSFNTSVSTFMIAVNELAAQKCNQREILKSLAILISPYAPHIAEELWSKFGYSKSISFVPFPVFEERHLVESTKAYPISFNGKMRFILELSLDLSRDDIESAVMSHDKTKQYLDGRTPKKVIIVPGKIVNIVG
jgi:leucyl-tRNA synthetase